MQKAGSVGLVFNASLLAMVLAFACAGTKSNGGETSQTKAFTLLGATVENWQAGRREGGSGTDYRLTIVVRTSQPIRFNDLWIKEKSILLPVTPGRTKGPVTNKPFSFSKGDTIALYAFTGPDVPKKAASPAPLSGDAILSYSTGGKKFYTAIPSFNQTNTPPRPQQ